MRQRHLETTERCSEMVADFMADNEKRSKGLISEIEGSRRKTATSYKKELIRLPQWKHCSLRQWHLSRPPPENAISEEGGKEFEGVKKAELEDRNREFRCLQELWPPTLLLCPLQLRDIPICSGNDRRKRISYPRICCHSEFAADIL